MCRMLEGFVFVTGELQIDMFTSVYCVQYSICIWIILHYFPSHREVIGSFSGFFVLLKQICFCCK